MDSTVMIALITASAGVAGGLTTGAVSALNTARQDRRVEARETVRWQRELAEKDRERLYQLFELIVATHQELFARTYDLLNHPAPQTPELQLASRDSGNELGTLCSRAALLGATELAPTRLTRMAAELRVALRNGPLNYDAQERFTNDYNREAALMRERMKNNLVRLRVVE